jgi:hypothetical protein
MYMTYIYIYDVYDIYDIYYGIWMDMVIHLIMEIRTMGIWIPVNGLMRVPQCG